MRRFLRDASSWSPVSRPNSVFASPFVIGLCLRCSSTAAGPERPLGSLHLMKTIVLCPEIPFSPRRSHRRAGSAILPAKRRATRTIILVVWDVTLLRCVRLLALRVGIPLAVSVVNRYSQLLARPSNIRKEWYAEKGRYLEE